MLIHHYPDPNAARARADDRPFVKSRDRRGQPRLFLILTYSLLM